MEKINIPMLHEYKIPLQFVSSLRGYDFALNINFAYQRDNEKNLTKSIEYDTFNRIKKVVDPDTGDLKGEYEYDDQGFRVRKWSLKETDKGLRDVEILYPSMYFGVEKDYKKNEKKVESVSAVNNVYLNGVRIAAVGSDNSARYYLTDQVDSVKVVVDDTGNVTTRLEYLPFGETWFSEGDQSNKPKYNSQELDEETNFYYNNARHYDPEIARFVTADKIIPNEINSQSWNRFSYVRNNPIIYKDPTGHAEKKCLWNKIQSFADKVVSKVKNFASDIKKNIVHSTLKSGFERSKEREKIKNSLRNSKDSGKVRFGPGITLKAKYPGRGELKNEVKGGGHLEGIVVYKSTWYNRKMVGDPQMLGTVIKRKGKPFEVAGLDGKVIGTLDEIHKKAKDEEVNYAGGSLLATTAFDAWTGIKTLAKSGYKAMSKVFAKETIVDPTNVNNWDEDKSIGDFLKDCTPGVSEYRGLKNLTQMSNWDEKTFHNSHLLKHVKEQK